jgi:hypothetical protein
MHIQPGASEVHQAETHSPANFADPGTLRAQQKSRGYALAVAKELHSSAVTYLTSSTHCLTISNRTSARSNAQGKPPVFPPVTIVNPQARAWRSGSMLCEQAQDGKRSQDPNHTPSGHVASDPNRRPLPILGPTQSTARYQGVQPAATRSAHVRSRAHRSTMRLSFLPNLPGLACCASRDGREAPQVESSAHKTRHESQRTGQSNASRQAGYPAAKRHPQQGHTAARTPRSRAAAGAAGTK